MEARSRVDKQTMLLGYGLVGLVVILGLVSFLFLTLNRELHAVQYPGSHSIRGYTNYTVRSDHLRLENAYRTNDSLMHIHHWYADEFDLRIYSETGECVALDGATNQLAVERLMAVLVCEASAGGGRIVFVTRAVRVK